jgi:hypothetical protein
MLNIETDLHPHPATEDVLRRNFGEFHLPVLVWIERQPGEWDHLTIHGPRDALHALNNGLGTMTDEGWASVVGQLAVALQDPTPDALERARPALAVFAARIGVLAG